jgi:hypothetical protein
MNRACNEPTLSRCSAEVRYLAGELSCSPAKVTAESVFNRMFGPIEQSGEGS